ncbi:MAG: tetratricopeptide repeat protein [Candidatus Binatia bacterium]
MTQATTHPQGKKLRHKDLKQPDEFISLSNRVIAWAQKNQTTVLAAVGVAVAVVLVAAGVRWYAQSRAEASARQFYGANELFKREQWDQAQKDFASLASAYGGTPYGNLAKLYAGRAALNASKPGEALPFLTEFVASPPSPAFEQIGRIALARALADTSNVTGAREQLDRAMLLDGPLKPEAMIRLARIEESDGSKEKSIELYKQYLTDEPDGSAAPLARARLLALGVQPPAAPSTMTLPLGGSADALQIQ